MFNWFKKKPKVDYKFAKGVDESNPYKGMFKDWVVDDYNGVNSPCGKYVLFLGTYREEVEDGIVTFGSRVHHLVKDLSKEQHKQIYAELEPMISKEIERRKLASLNESEKNMRSLWIKQGRLVPEDYEDLG